MDKRQDGVKHEPDKQTPMKIRKRKTDRFRWAIWRAFTQRVISETEGNVIEEDCEE